MKKTSKILALLLALALCFALAGACSDTSAPGASGSGEPSSSPSGEADDDLGYIRGNGEIIIGYTDYAPMNYFNDAGEFTGFDTEFAEAVCGKLGVTPNFVEINWDTKEIELAAKTIDCIWNGLTITAERAENMSISLPYVMNAQVVVVKADSGITSTADLVGKAVSAEAGSAGESMIQGGDADENLAGATYIQQLKQTDCLVEVLAGTVDACVLDWTLAKTMTGEGTDFSGLVMIEGLFLAEEEYGVAFRKGSNVTAEVDAIIKELVADGTLPALAEKYGLSLSPEIEG